MSIAANLAAAQVLSINLGAVAYGLAAIGPGIGIGLVFGHAIEAMCPVRSRSIHRRNSSRKNCSLDEQDGHNREWMGCCYRYHQP